MMRESLRDPEQAALVIMDNFKGQVTPAMNELLEANYRFVCLTRLTYYNRWALLSTSLHAKDFLKWKFEHWYSDKVTSQLQGVSDIESTEIQSIDLSMAVVKELSAHWLVEMAEYIVNNPQFIMSGFHCSGITIALDGVKNVVRDDVDEESGILSEDEYETDEDFIDLSD